MTINGDKPHIFNFNYYVAQWVFDRPGAWVGSGDPSHPSKPEHHPPLSHILAPLHSHDSTHY